MVCGFNNNLAKYTQVEDFFCLNLDETNFMASEGALRIVGNNDKKKQEKNSNGRTEQLRKLGKL
jgi:hypothetical protein